MKDDDDTQYTEQQLKEAVLAERETCARVVEQAGIDGLGTLAAAALIRARGEDPMPLFDDWEGGFK